jgi:7-cyano-7-deazaguanine synthase
MEETQRQGGRVFVLVSGGIESSVMLSEALSNYDEVTPIYVKHGLRWEYAEIFWLKKFIWRLKSPKLRLLEMLDLNMRDLYSGHWSVTGSKVPGANSTDEAVCLPGRNLIMFSKIATHAVLRNVPVIEIGILKTNPFSDASPKFLKKMSEAVSMGLGKEIALEAPFGRLKKEEVIIKGKKLPLELTFSCINPKGYDHCGDCNKCVERKKAFFAAGIFDKTKYRKSGV